MEDELVLKVEMDAEKVSKNLAAATKALAEHKQQQKELRKAMEESNGTNAVAAKMYAEVSAQIEKESRAVKSNTALLQAETLARLDENSSLDEQRQALKAAQKAYALLSGEEKKAADASGGLRDQIAKLSDRVKEQEAAIGDARRNVGNYAMQTAEAAGKMGFFGKGIASVVNPLKNFENGLKAASATPLIAILSVAITILQKLAERFKGNSAAMEKMTEVFGVFSGVGNIVNKIIDKIAEGIGWIAEKALSLAEKLGILTAEMKEGQRIAKEDYEIYNKRTELIQKEAEVQQTVADLRNKIAQKDKYTNAERLKFLNEAIELEKGIAKEREDIARREYEQIKAKNALSNSSQEDLRKEAEAYAAMQKAQTDYLNTTIRLQSQAAALAQEIKNEEIGRAENLRELNAKIDDFIKKSTEYSVAVQTSIEKMQEARDELTQLDEEEDEAFVEPLNYYQQVLADCMKQGDDFKTAQVRAAAIIRGEWADAASTMASGFANAFGAVSDMLAEYGEENEAAMAASKAFALAGVLASEAETIANGIKGVSAAVASGAGVPFPANLAAIASGVAAVTSTIAGVVAGITQAKQILSQNTQKFADGGIVKGNSYSGDRVPVLANSSEMFINTRSQKRLFDALTGNGDGSLGINYEMLAAAMAAQPAPVMALKEFRDFEDRVATFKEIASI